MASIIGGYDTGLLDSSLFLLNRDDRTSEGSAGHGEALYVNVANGNLLLQHKDAFLPSQGEDFYLIRTYNSRGTWGGTDGPGWSNSGTVLELSQINKNVITLIKGDTSRGRFSYDAGIGKYVSVDGAGAYEVLSFDSGTKRYTLVQADQTVLTFDGNGDFLSSRDTNGNLIEYTYAQGKLASIRDDQGHVITYVYSNGNLTQIKDETGVALVSYGYDQGRMISVTDRAGHITRYTYFTDGQIASVTLPAGTGEAERKLAFEYDPDPTDNTGKTRILRSLTDGEGNRTAFEYTFNVDNYSKYNGGQTVVVNALGINRKESNAAEYVQWRLANGFYETWDAARYSVDAAYRAQAGAITGRHTVTYGYDKNGAITQVVDQSGNRTQYRYDDKENLTAVVDANAYAITHSDDAVWRNLRRDYGYTDLAGQGRLVGELTSAELDALTERYTTHLDYDSKGNLIRRTDNGDNLTSYTYTAFNKLESKIAAMGNALVTSDSAFAQEKRLELGFAQLVAGLSVADKAALLERYTTHYRYDAKQNLTEVISAGNDITRYTYDQYGNQLSKIVYQDAADLLDPAKQSVTQYFYDQYGQNIKTVDAEGGITYDSYDHFGNRLTHTDANGGVTRYSYDADNRLLSVTDPEGFVTAYSYDSVGNRIAVRDANGHSVLYVYDRNNMLVTVVDPKEGDPAANRVTSYGYDVVGNRTSVEDAEGRTTTYLYQENNRLLEVRTPQVAGADGNATTYVTRYQYDGVGNRLSVQDHNGNLSQYVYHETGLLKQTTDATGNVTQYGYDANLNQLQIVIGMQLAQEKRRVLRYSFDEEDQRVAEIDALGGVTRYALDAVGNVVSVTDANGHATDFAFDRNNRLVKETRPEVTDPATGTPVRQTVVHQYDKNGNQISSTDENGHTTQYTFDKDNRLVLVTDGNGIKTTYTYDSRHNRARVAIGVDAHVDATGRVVIDSAQDARVGTFSYNEFNQLTAKTDGLGNALVTSDSALYRTLRQEMGFAAAVADLTAADQQALLAAYTDRYSYDRVGNTLSTTDHLGRTTEFQFDALNRLTRRTDAQGSATRYAYDGNGNRVATTDALGRQQTAAYDAANRLVEAHDALGVLTHRAYDNVGNLIAETQAAGTAEARTTRFEYDLNNRLTASTDPEGNRQAYAYDAVGNRLQVVDGRGNASQYVYDARNRLVKTIDPLGFETRSEYDGVGNRIALIDARGGITRFEFDAGNRLIATTDAEGRLSQFEFDRQGNRVIQRSAVGTIAEALTQFEYDAEGNLRAVVDAAGQRATSDFDRVYNRVGTTDGNGHSTSYAFDAVNRLLEVTDAVGAKTSYAYDAVGNRLSRTDALGRVTAWSYDADNRNLSETAADGVVTRYTYDAVDNRIAVVQAAGTVDARQTVYQYDLNNRLVAQTDALGGTTRHVYDANGNVTTTIDALGRSTGYSYDANNRVTQITDPLGFVTKYRYDAVGNRVQVIDPLGHAVTSYFNLDRELTLTVDAEGSATAWAYDAQGNRVRQTRYATPVLGADPTFSPVLVAAANDAVSSYGYDKLNRLTRTVDAEGYVVDNVYDAVGNLMASRAYANAIVVDAAQALGAQTPVAAANDRLVTFSYDAVNRLVGKVDAEGYSTAYAYDAVGNRLSQTSYLDKIDFSNPAQQRTTLSAYDALNRLTAITDPAGATTSYVYDAIGNRTSRTDALGRVTTWTYDGNNRLIAETTADGVVAQYGYDAVGNRTQQVLAVGTADQRQTFYTFDGNNRLIAETDAFGNTTRREYDADGNVAATINALGDTTRYAYDGNHRLVQVTDPLGAVTAYHFDAFGNRVETIDALGKRATNYFDRKGELTLAIDAEGSATTWAYDAQGNRVAQTRYATPVLAADPATRPTLVASADDETTRFGYDKLNRVTRTADAEGFVVDNVYDGVGNLIASRAYANAIAVNPAQELAAQTPLASAQDRLVAFAYDAVNRLVRKADAEGYTTAYSYDLVGNRLSQTLYLDKNDLVDPAKQQTVRFTYDLLNRLLSETSPLGIETRHAYNAVGQVASTREAVGTPGERQSQYRYDAAGRLVESENAEGTVTRRELDAAGQVVVETVGFGLADARVTTNAYDGNGRLVARRHPDGSQTQWAYNAVGNLAERIDAAGSADQRTVRFAYDGNHRLVRQTTAAGTPAAVAQRYAYDAFGNRTLEVLADGTTDARTMSYAFDHNNRRIAEIDGNGIAKLHDYDAFGNRIRTTLQGTTLSAGGTEISRLEAVSFEYDGRNLVIREENGAHEVLGRSFDAAGNLRYETRAQGSGNAVVTEFQYDLGNRLTAKVTDPSGLALATSYAYDKRGNLVAETDADGVTRHSQYDVMNRAVAVTDGEGFTVSFAYDRFGNQVAITTGQYFGQDPAKAGRAMPATTRFAFDGMNRMSYQADALGTVTQFGYDARGNRIAKSEAAGRLATGAELSAANIVALDGEVPRITRYTYDLLDRLIDETQPTGAVVRTTYTAAGERAAKTVDFGGINATTTYAYDAAGRPAFETDPLGVVTQYQYDDFGNRVRSIRGLTRDGAGQPVASAATRVTAYEYDAVHRLTAEVVDPQGLNLRTAYEYDTRGNRTAVVDAAGARSEMAFDAADRAVWMRDAEGYVTAATFDGRGNKLTETRFATPADSLARGQVPVASAADRSTAFAYDGVGRLQAATDARGVVTQLRYDAIGNLLAKTENATGILGANPRVTSYTYNLANLVTVQADPSGLITAFSYDAVYNLVEKQVDNRILDTLSLDAAGHPVERIETQLTRYTYDLNNRRTEEVVDPDGLNLRTAYRYDGLGNRIAVVGANGFAAANDNAAWAVAARRELGLVDVAGNGLPAGALNAEQRQRVLDAYTSRTWFDAAGRAVLTSDANGYVKQADYDGVGNLVRETRYATPVSAQAAAGMSADQLRLSLVAANDDRVTDNTYDQADRLVSVRLAAARTFVDGAWQDDYRVTHGKAYDAVGNLVRETDGNGYSTYHYYDANRREIGQIDGEGYLTVYTLDAFGQKVAESLSFDRPLLSISEKQALDLAAYVPAGEARVIRRQYDAVGNETRTELPKADLFLGGVESRQALSVQRVYDAYGYLRSETVQHAVAETNPAATVYQYDALGHRTAQTDARGNLTTYAYDSQGNLRDMVEGERVTTYEYDRANRVTQVHLPATDLVETAADGSQSATAGVRAVGTYRRDAAGNVLVEGKADGSQIAFRFDRGGRRIAALDLGVYVSYSYDLGGAELQLRRHAIGTDNIYAPPATSDGDQIVFSERDRLGRVVAETQLGVHGDASDDRVVRYGYDANGNQVSLTDARGFNSTLIYDGLNRMVGTVNPAGGLVATVYDAQGKVVARKTGGFEAPSFRGSVSRSEVADRGLVIEWSTDRPTEGVVSVRRAGSLDAWQTIPVLAHTVDHRVAVSGLSPLTNYEYFVTAQDAFGYTLTSSVGSFHTAAGVDAVVVDGVSQTATGWQASVRFALPAGAQAAAVRVGMPGSGLDLVDAQSFVPVLEADGSYRADVTFSNPDSQFQIVWSDGDGQRLTVGDALQQTVESRRFDGHLAATANSAGGYDFTAEWNLGEALAASDIQTYTDADGATHYRVYAGYVPLDADGNPAKGADGLPLEPNYREATLNNGRFVTSFVGIKDGPRAVYFRYVRADASEVLAAPVTLSTLAGLDLTARRLEFAFPGVDPSGASLAVQYRKVGESTWTDLPASAINGLSADLAGLGKSAYEFTARLKRDGITLRQVAGSFSLKTPASAKKIVDAQTTTPVDYALVGDRLNFAALIDVASNESIEVRLTDANGVASEPPVADGGLVLASYPSGSYQLKLVKKQTVTTTTPVLDATGKPVLNADGTPKTVTTTTVTILSDISGQVTIAPVTLAEVSTYQLSGSRELTAVAVDLDGADALVGTATGTASSIDYTWNHYDANGWKTFSNEDGGVWTRYFYDAQGHVSKEVRFRRRDAAGAFLDKVQNDAQRPALAALEADYAAALAAYAAGQDTARTITREFDAAGNKLSETRVSRFGNLSDRFAYDRFNNKVEETTAAGIIGEELITRSVYDGRNRLVSVEVGPFTYRQESGQTVTASSVERFAYDARGNKTQHVDARGFVERFAFDAANRLAHQWDAQSASGAGGLRSDYAYDVFGRVSSVTEVDLASGQSRTRTQAYDRFDQQVSHTDALGNVTTMAYDASGNLVTKTDALGHSEQYAYDAEKRLVQRTDRLGQSWRSAYDAYGQKVAETDANGRVTTYTVGAFGQVLAKQTVLTSTAYVSGATQMSERTGYDWTGRVVDVQDSFGKHQVNRYDDLDRLVRVDDLATGRSAVYGYNAHNQRTSEILYDSGVILRSQTNQFNAQGWLTKVHAEAGFEIAGSKLNQQLDASYAYDAAGNRVAIGGNSGGNQYRYDANGRMLQAVDGGTGKLVSAIQYDGFGNRVLATEDGQTTSYQYDAAGRVTSSSAGESWGYDALGNTVRQVGRDGAVTTTQLNAEGRATYTHSQQGGNVNQSWLNYDAAGNVLKTTIRGGNYGYDEIALRDVRYLEQTKYVANSYAEGAARMEGQSTLSYDANSNLVLLNRGARQGSSEATLASFDYDLEGHIIGRADRAALGNLGDFFYGDHGDTVSYDEYGSGTSARDAALATVRAGGKWFRRTVTNSATTHLKSYLYVDNHPLAEASVDHRMEVKSLNLSADAIPVTQTDTEGNVTVVDHVLALQDGDLVIGTDGRLDRAATAKQLATRAYVGYADLSAGAQAKIDAYVLTQLNTSLPTDDAVKAGAKVSLYTFIRLVDNVYSNAKQITDYAFRTIGEGIPGGQAMSHVVRAGETLQSIAALYFGSPAYWYLIAETNGLSGSAALTEGTTLTIPNQVTNSANTSETWKVYNEGEIIGSTSPEIRTIQKPKKKKKWYQKLVQVLIIVILIVAVIITAGAALAVMGAAAPGLLAMGASLATSLGVAGAGVAAAGAGALATAGAFMAGVAISAAIGATVYAAANILNQGLSMAAGLQEKFSWRAVGQAAKSGAISGAAAAVTAGVSKGSGTAWKDTAVRVSVEAGKQYATDGKITNVAGLVGAMAGGGTFGATVKEYSGTFTTGLSMLEKSVRGGSVNTMDWVSLATSAYYDGRASDSSAITKDNGGTNWEMLAVSTAGALIVGNRFGEDAGLNFFGNALGSGLTARAYRDKAIYEAQNGVERNPATAGLTTDEKRQIAIASLDRRDEPERRVDPDSAQRREQRVAAGDGNVATQGGPRAGEGEGQSRVRDSDLEAVLGGTRDLFQGERYQLADAGGTTSDVSRGVIEPKGIQVEIAGSGPWEQVQQLDNGTIVAKNRSDGSYMVDKPTSGDWPEIPGYAPTDVTNYNQGDTTWDSSVYLPNKETGQDFQTVNDQRVAAGTYDRFSEMGNAWSEGRYGDVWQHMTFEASEPAVAALNQLANPSPTAAQLKFQTDLGLAVGGPVLTGWAAGARLFGAPDDVVNDIGLAQAGLVGALAPTVLGRGSVVVRPEWGGPVRYENLLVDSPRVGPGKDFSSSQKTDIYTQNIVANRGLLRSDLDGEVLVLSGRDQSGVTPPKNAAQLDHIIPRKPADPLVQPGSNSYSNAEVLSRIQNRRKSNH